VHGTLSVGGHFKTVNHNGKKTRVRVEKITTGNNVYYAIKFVRLIREEELPDLAHFIIIKKFKNYLLVENEMVFMEKTFKAIVNIVINL